MPGLRIAAFVMAGGEGARLRPLTDELPKPALPFADHCRLIDFVLENLRHSAVAPVYVLLQYKPQALLQHLRRHWPDIRPLLPTRGFDGTADAVAQCLHCLDLGAVDLVAVLAADHVYRMDLRQMADFHRQRRAGVTVAALPVPLAEAPRFGILGVDGRSRIRSFDEKPARACAMPGDEDRALASMGIYLFEPVVLADALHDARSVARPDFGRDVIPALVRAGRACGYDFRRNVVPGLQPFEERGYWRDVGTLPAYRQAQRDVGGAASRLVLANPRWPIARTLAGAAVVATEAF